MIIAIFQNCSGDNFSPAGSATAASSAPSTVTATPTDAATGTLIQPSTGTGTSTGTLTQPSTGTVTSTGTTATATGTSANPQTGSQNLIPGTITNITVTGVGDHAFSGVGCPAGYTDFGSIADYSGGGLAFGRIDFCGLPSATATEIISDIQVTNPGLACPAGYTAASQTLVGDQTVCFMLINLSNATAVVTNFYPTTEGQPCNSGDLTVGQTHSTDSSFSPGYTAYFCETISRIN